MTSEQAEEIAISALQLLAQDPGELGRFLALTGMGPDTVRAAATDPGFLAGVLEYVMANEPLLLVFTEQQRLRPTMIAAAHFLLAGSTPNDGFL